MNQPSEAHDRELPDWKFPDLCEHLLASQLLATHTIITHIPENAAQPQNLQLLPIIRPLIPTLQPTFVPTPEQWEYIDRLDARTHKINALIIAIQSIKNDEHESNAQLMQLENLLNTLFEEA